MAVSRGSVDKVVREMCPGIDLDEEITQFHLGKACRDEAFKGFRTGGPVLCLQGRQNDLVVLNTDMTVFASQELLDLGHTCNGLQSKWLRTAIIVFLGPDYLPLSISPGPDYLHLSLQSTDWDCNQRYWDHIICNSTPSPFSARPSWC